MTPPPSPHTACLLLFLRVCVVCPSLVHLTVPHCSKPLESPVCPVFQQISDYSLVSFLFPVVLSWGQFCIPLGDVWQCLKMLFVIPAGGGVLLRPRMLLSILQCTKHYPPQMSVPPSFLNITACLFRKCTLHTFLG